MKLTGVLVCCPAYGQNITAHTTETLYCLSQWMTAEKIQNRFSWFSMADIAEARNIFLTNWYFGAKELSHLFFVDSDMHFSPYLLRDMLNFKKPVTSAIYARRQMPARAVGKMLTPDDTVDDVKDGFLKVAGTGCGATLIYRAAIEQMIRKMPEICDTRIEGHVARETLKAANAPYLIRAFEPMMLPTGEKISEDLAFCQRWRDCGGDVWANVNHLIGHVGPFNFAIRYADYLETKARDAKMAEAA